MFKRILSILILAILVFSSSGSALAQVYYFRVSELNINVYWNDDGSSEIIYRFTFINDSTDPIEFVDLGLPNGSFDESQISADVDGKPVAYISRDEFYGEGDGVAVALGANSIPSGQTGTVTIHVPRIENVLYRDDDDNAYASAVFKNPYFESSVVHDTTDLRVTFHFPVSVQTDEPRWHASPPGFPEEPGVGFDENDRIVYIWRNTEADLSRQYEFGASFPMEYVPEQAIVRSNPFAFLSNISLDALFPLCCFGGIALAFVLGVFSDKKRKMQYLPPKISIEGHGIKRGLTAVEAAILLEQPLDKVLTMVLFGLIKKGAAEVTRREPLEVKAITPQPEGLHEYEKDFLTAFTDKTASVRRGKTEAAVVSLVKSVAEKMKGFSRAETAQYYKSITQRAWEQVEAANTPEVKSQKFDEMMEWTMLDRDYDDRTRDVFRNQPVYVPVWWGHFDPSYSPRPSVSTGGGAPSARPSAGGTSLPNLPGSDFAASIANGVQGFAAGVAGNITNFTSNITGKTNPVPKSTSSSSYKGGGSSGGRSCACACACACAGCACACAGGGR